MTTKIEWTDNTWSPIRARVKSDAGEIATAKGYSSLVQIATKMAGHVGPHCEPVSDGCKHCYSDTNNSRCLPSNGTGLPFDRRSRDLVDPFVDEKILVQPLKWKPVRIHAARCGKTVLGKQAACTCQGEDKYRTRPLRIFVENQSDLFGEWVTDEQIDRVFAVMALCPQHTFQVLTKRPEQMFKWISRGPLRVSEFAKQLHTKTLPFTLPSEKVFDGRRVARGEQWRIHAWPLPNVWLGVSVEDQKTADARIPILLQTPAAARFISYEPALGPVDFGAYMYEGIIPRPPLDWIIVGGESGPGARPFDIAWARQTVKQCGAADVACFVKQLGAKPMGLRPCCDACNFQIDAPKRKHGLDCAGAPVLKDRKGGDMSEWPDDLQVREFPQMATP